MTTDDERSLAGGKVFQIFKSEDTKSGLHLRKMLLGVNGIESFNMFQQMVAIHAERSTPWAEIASRYRRWHQSDGLWQRPCYQQRRPVCNPAAAPRLTRVPELLTTRRLKLGLI
eukprot:s868_g28.t1